MMGMSDTPLAVVVLAAGQGTRMRSERPKPLLQYMESLAATREMTDVELVLTLPTTVVTSQ